MSPFPFLVFYSEQLVSLPIIQNWLTSRKYFNISLEAGKIKPLLSGTVHSKWFLTNALDHLATVPAYALIYPNILVVLLIEDS